MPNIDDEHTMFERLGIHPIINAIGSVTMLGGSTPTAAVKKAMDGVELSYVSMIELQEKAGCFLAQLLDVPAAYITSGAGSALTLAAAAVMTGDNDKYIEQLPNTSNMKNQILIQKRQRYWYDRCLEASGAQLVEFGTKEKTTKQYLETAINRNTEAVHYYMVEQNIDPFALSLEDTIEIAHSKNVPVLVDAAGQIYPLDLIGKYVRMGADFQCVAAKYLGAPQSTGLAIGSKHMIDLISKQSFVGYESRRVRGIGRPHKLDKQEIVGVVAAVEEWMTLNHENRLEDIEYRTNEVINILSDTKAINATKIINVTGHQPFGLEVRINNNICNLSLVDLVDHLRKGTPPIWTRVVDGNDHITIHMFGLKEGENKLVGQRIAEFFI